MPCPPRYQSEPRKYVVFVAIWNHIYGLGLKEYFDLEPFEVTEDEFEEIWATAWDDFFGNSKRFCHVCDPKKKKIK